MKIAIVHDYIKEFGGAERVLLALSEMFPDAPIYTAFRVKNSTADKQFRGKKIIESWLAPVLKIGTFYSPLRFLSPYIWGSFDLSGYDLVITSSSWYITRGFKVGNKTKVVCYCHTPPRWLYGYETSVGFTKYLPVKVYSIVVGHFMRLYDFETAQKIEHWIANSMNVQRRIQKFYRKESTVIYPPIDVKSIAKLTRDLHKKDYYLVVSRLVGAKGILETAEIIDKLGIKLKIVGEASGFKGVLQELSAGNYKNVELVGRLDDAELYKTMAEARCLIALARDEDFGMTVVEAQAAGTPVIAFNGGGFRESMIDGVTGVLINDISSMEIEKAVKKIESKKWNKQKLIDNALKFSKERFTKEMLRFIDEVIKKNTKDNE